MDFESNRDPKFSVPSLEGKKEGVTAGYIFSGATPIGIFSLSDTCRTGVPEAINELKELGLKTAMLTGDNRGAAMHIQDQVIQMPNKLLFNLGN